MRQLLNATAYCNTNAMCLHSARHLDSTHTAHNNKKGFLLAMPGIPLSSVRFPRCSLGTTKEGLEGENRKEERETFRVFSSARKKCEPANYSGTKHHHPAFSYVRNVIVSYHAYRHRLRSFWWVEE